jgi:pimeloyl-ACP methyl ester carboxylesterase
MTTATQTWTEEFIEVAGVRLHLRRAGTGSPVLLLHHDIGTPDALAFPEALAQQHTVYLPAHPGFDQSERPAWMRSVRDVAVVYQWLLANLALDNVSIIGLGFGGWIAAEMATMAPRSFRRLVLAGAMGIQPERGEILDQALVNTMDYIRAGLHDSATFDRLFGDPDTDQLEQWEITREMTFRIAWKPYMYSQTLPHLLGGVQTPALVVWGAEDRVVPLECGERYAAVLPNARLDVIPECGHLIDLERPDELARLVMAFLAD